MRLALACAALVLPATASVFPPGATTRDVPRLLAATAVVRALDEATLRAAVPAQSGLNFVGCPNCNGGRQEGQLAWTPDRPGEVYCQYCGHRYPSAKYPMSNTLVVHNPRGEVQPYAYWADAKGYRYFFEARRADLVKTYLAGATRDLAQLYAVTGDTAYAARAAVLLDQFARVFPGWCYHYDYPFQQKQIYDGDVPPAKFRAGFRTARWTWWAYSDIPTPLVQAYDWIRSSGALSPESAARIERDLLRNAGDQVYSNVDDLTNMSPSAWNALITLGRVIGEPRYVQEPAQRLQRFLATQFFYDAVWHEGAPSYHAQTLGGLTNVLNLLRGYSDPPGYADPAAFPLIAQSSEAFLKMRFPDGREVPVHDTWSTDKRAALAETTPYLLPALGHACLGGGAGEAQQQFHMTWSGGYGHQHADNLALLAFARGREMLSDLGYTHTRYRAWTLATASHNTVVIDGANQNSGSASKPSDGALRLFEAAGAGVQVVSAGGERGYPGLAKVYRRTLAVLDGAYAVDLFEVEGGAQHDYFLHGDADGPATATVPLATDPLATLLPAGMDWKAPQNEGELSGINQNWYAYGFLRHLRAATVPPGAPLAVTFRGTAAGAPGVRVTLLPEPASLLVLGENPSIRQAAEDDARLESFLRPFLMLRHAPAEGRSAFLAVIEPFGAAPPATLVERLAVAGAVAAVRVRSGSRADTVVFGAPSPVRIPAGAQTALFQGEIGVLTVDGDSVLRAYALGDGGWMWGSSAYGATVVRASLESIDAGGRLLVSRDGSLPAPGDVLRVLPSDGWVYPYTVVAAEDAGGGMARIAVAEGPGLSLAGGTLQLTAYPQRTHTGAVMVDWQAPARFQTNAVLTSGRGRSWRNGSSTGGSGRP